MKNKIFKSSNSWDYYFEPVSKSSLKDAYRNGKITHVQVLITKILNFVQIILKIYKNI